MQFLEKDITATYNNLSPGRPLLDLYLLLLWVGCSLLNHPLLMHHLHMSTILLYHLHASVLLDHLHCPLMLQHHTNLSCQNEQNHN